MTNVILYIIIIVTILSSTCKFIYEPIPEPLPSSEEERVSIGGYRVFPINGTAQICNPSISMDTVNFKGCMLWLNFSGTLQVNVPPGINFDRKSLQHDRLTITDTSNSVRWFMKRESLGVDEREEFQDPEWSTHPEYIVTLLSSDAQKKWGCVVIHLLTNKYLRICKEGLNQTSTPHLWVPRESFCGEIPQNLEYDEEGFVDIQSITSFFGTSNVKIVVAKKKDGALTLYYKDYSDSLHNRLIQLTRPPEREGWNCESPLISPDGKWIAFNVYKSTKYYEIWIQKLSPSSKPFLFKENASDPHWWRHPYDTSLLYLIYQEVPGDNLVIGDLSDKKLLETGELGITYRQMIKLFETGETQTTAFVKIGTPERLVNLPTKGGLSPDGKYLCTGYDRGFIIGLP